MLYCDQYHSLKVAFRNIDTDANGTISLDEFAEALQRLSPQIGVDLTPDQIAQLVQYYDQDGARALGRREERATREWGGLGEMEGKRARRTTLWIVPLRLGRGLARRVHIAGGYEPHCCPRGAPVAP